MKKILMGVLLAILCKFSYSEVFVKIYEPIRFKTHNTRGFSSDVLVGEGMLEIYTDNEEEDLGKKIIFRFPDSGMMTNKKKMVKIKKFALEKEENSMIITEKRELVKIYAFLDKGQFSNSKDADFVEGEYIGHIPVILSLYKRK